MNLFANHMVTAILAEALVSVLLLALGYLVGKYRERRQLHGRDLTDYDFYPYQTTADNFAEFSLRDFRLGMHYLLRNRDAERPASSFSLANRTTYAICSTARTSIPSRSCFPNIVAPKW